MTAAVIVHPKCLDNDRAPWRVAESTRLTVNAVSDPQPFEQALRVLTGTPTVLTALMTIAQENRAGDWRVSAGAWSPRQILAHLLVIERALNPPAAPPRRRIGWLRPSSRRGSQVRPAEVESPLESDSGTREQPRVAAHTTPDAAHASIHPRHGCITPDQHVVEWAYYDLDHLRYFLHRMGALSARP
jgi:hypothetical protein